MSDQFLFEFFETISCNRGFNFLYFNTQRKCWLKWIVLKSRFCCSSARNANKPIKISTSKCLAFYSTRETFLSNPTFRISQEESSLTRSIVFLLTFLSSATIGCFRLVRRSRVHVRTKQLLRRRQCFANDEGAGRHYSSREWKVALHL